MKAGGLSDASSCERPPPLPASVSRPPPTTSSSVLPRRCGWPEPINRVLARTFGRDIGPTRSGRHPTNSSTSSAWRNPLPRSPPASKISPSLPDFPYCAERNEIHRPFPGFELFAGDQVFARDRFDNALHLSDDRDKIKPDTSSVANIPKPTVAATAALCVLKQSVKLPQLSASADVRKRK